MRVIFILKEIWTQDKIYIVWYALCLVEIFYSLVITGTGFNYKQQIMSPAKVRKVC
jgi:hypothetical protein